MLTPLALGGVADRLAQPAFDFLIDEAGSQRLAVDVRPGVDIDQRLSAQKLRQLRQTPWSAL
jgi:hypothetical protein